MKKKSVRGGMVTMLSQGISIAIQLASTVILARLLSPDDYGTIAMVMAITSFAGLFRDLGLSSAAIQKKDLTDAQQSNLFWLNVAMGAALTTLVAAASPLVARFYGKPELISVTLALSFSFLIGSLGAQHATRLMRDMQFGRRAAATIAGSLVTLAVAVVCALQGLAYWALVWGNLAGGVVGTLLLFLLSPFWPSWYRKGAGIRGMLGFGANVTAFDFVNYFHRNLDNILIGRFWGALELGLYSRAYSLLMLPINSVRGPINAVAFPAMSRLQEQPSAYRNYYCKVARLLSLATMPLTAFLFISSDSVIFILLGPEWLGIPPIFSVLALVAFVQPVITLWGMVVLSSGMGHRYLKLGIFNTLCSAIGFACGLPWGPFGVACGYAVVTYATAYPILYWAFRGTPVSVLDFLKAVARPFIASAIAASVSYKLTRLVSFLNAYEQFCIAGISFLIVFITMILCLPHGRKDLSLLYDLIEPVFCRLTARASSRYKKL